MGRSNARRSSAWSRHGLGAIISPRTPAPSRGASTSRVRARSSAVSIRREPSRWRWSSAFGIATSQARRAAGSLGAARRGGAMVPVGSSTGPMLRCRPMPRTLRRALLTAPWPLIAAVIAVGGAGLAAATTNPPGSASRAELTAPGDAAAAPGLERAETELDDLTQDVQRLGDLGRTGLGALVDSKFTELDQTVADGQALAASIEDRSAAIRTELTQLPGTGSEEALTWSPETRRRRDVALAALDATQGLEGAWIKLAAGATTANKLTSLLVDHDTIAGKAAASGKEGKYAAALKTLATAEARLDAARALRDAL